MTKDVLLDADIREPLFSYLELYYGKVRFLEEKVTGKARADVVMVLPNKVCGIEIKSDADSYTRLAAQVKNYDRYYDENYLVVGSTHALHAAEHVPAYWGIISENNASELYFEESDIEGFVEKLEKLYPNTVYVNRLMEHSWGTLYKY